MTMKMIQHQRLLLLVLLAGGGCIAKPVDMMDRPCDDAGLCATGFRCDQGTNTCVPQPGGACDHADVPCGSDVGACRTGLYSCVHGVWSDCSGVLPKAEACNGVDDDCDGETDEDNSDNDGDGYFSCDPEPTRRDCDDTRATVNPGATELCNKLDDNCDGSTDESFPEKGGECSVGLGECTRSATFACSDGAIVCAVQPGDPAVESCDGRDNDCDGATDEDFPLLGQRCTIGVGACKSEGVYVCAGGVAACNAPSIPPAVVESACDGIDEDCNGIVDDIDKDGDGFRPCLTVPALQRDCNDDNDDVYPGAPEICDGLVNDCAATSKLADGTDDPLYDAPCDGEDTDLELDDRNRCVGGTIECKGWWNPSYARRIKLVIPATGFITGDKEGVPVLVTLVAHGAQAGTPRVDAGWLAASTGQDIRFVAGNDDDVLPAAIDQWSDGRLWVRVPTVYAAGSTTLYMYYDSQDIGAAPTAPVWPDTQYRGVWHLGSDTAGDELKDASAAQHDLSQVTGSGDASATGVIGDGRSFDADDQIAMSDSHSDLQLAGDLSVSFWLKLTNTASGRVIGYCGPTTAPNDNCQYRVRLSSNKLVIDWESGSGSTSMQTTVTSSVSFSAPPGTWHHYAVTRAAGGFVEFYFDGAKLGDIVNFDWRNPPDGGSTAKLYIGAGPGSANGVPGVLDEVEVIPTGRSFDWIKLQYQSMADTLLSYQPEELRY